MDNGKNGNGEGEKESKATEKAELEGEIIGKAAQLLSVGQRRKMITELLGMMAGKKK